MIKLERPECPAHLSQEKTARWTRDLCKGRKEFHKRFKEDSGIGGTSKPKANPKKYAHQSVKAALRIASGSKCSYCEAEVEATGFPHVDHYRPQSIYPLLAYDWDNLISTCSRCNIQKSDRFPLAPDGLLATENIDQPCANDGKSEEPLLINPYIDDPADHIKFDDGLIDPISEHGIWTIETYRLNRDPLKTDRLKHQKFVKRTIQRYLLNIATDDQHEIAESIQDIIELTHHHATYAGMARAECERADIDWKSLAS